MVVVNVVSEYFPLRVVTCWRLWGATNTLIDREINELHCIKNN